MPVSAFRVGEGHDTHRTIAGRSMVVGGVLISNAPFGLDGHSDADVLLHAIIDALLGATGHGDIGEWFPNTSDTWKDADSAMLLKNVVDTLYAEHWSLINLDCTIHAEHPRMGPWKPQIRQRLAELLAVTPEQINVKAKSGEKVGPVGRGESLSADAVVLMSRQIPPQAH
ncbi:MAG: 2-C-methyl-D-erythritol 2,4-cyclodiphosphate synthase [Planctomycetota bacterium]|jgi:2-C-methyl-D-erythritol 2,4-cyclodiphosphate synthase